MGQGEILANGPRQEQTLAAVKTGMFALLAAAMLAPTLRESHGQTTNASTFWTMNSSI
jgi:hypothetical protein